MSSEAGGTGDVDGFFEVGALQRIGLVEHREGLEGPAPKQALDGDFITRDVSLDEQRAWDIASAPARSPIAAGSGGGDGG